MAWENKIVGYTISTYNDTQTLEKPIRTDAVFLGVTSEQHCDRLGIRYFINTYHYHIPIYKKVRTKKLK